MGFGSACGNVEQFAWPGAKFACEAAVAGRSLVAGRQRPRAEALVLEALKEKQRRGRNHQHGILRGARSGAARLGDIVVIRRTRLSTPSAAVRAGTRFTPSIVWPSPPPEKRTLRNQTGAIAVEMEAAAVERKAARMGCAVLLHSRGVGPRAEKLAAGFQSLSRRATDDFARTRIALAAMARPFTVMPELLRVRPELPQGRRTPGRFSCRLPILDVVTAEPALATMHAAVYKGASVVAVESVPVPEIGPGEILIRVESCGICHTDLKKIDYNLLPPPRIYGHETAGVVAAVGAGVTKYPARRPRGRVSPHPLRRMFLLPAETVRAMPGVQESRRHGGIRAGRRRLLAICARDGLDRRARRREDSGRRVLRRRPALSSR